MEVTEERENKMQNPINGGNSNSKPKVVVIMGATGSGKSKLAIDLASQFPIEIINADSMQVYSGLDILTNKVTPEEQKGVSHHLLGTISPNIDFTAKDFRDLAIPIIDQICSFSKLPVIVGGTNYYIQALVSPFLLDDDVSVELTGDVDDPVMTDDVGVEFTVEVYGCSYQRLKEIDPVAANRIHPNNDRKIKQYLDMYARFGVVPSKLLQDRTVGNWGRVDNSRYDFCFVCVNVALSNLDRFVDTRVDRMVDDGLLKEVFDVYKLDADYTKGLRQAIGVREFESFLRHYSQPGSFGPKLCDEIVDSDEYKLLLSEAIEKVKLNTRRLVRRQRRRINRLQTLFGWNVHYVDATNSVISGSDDIWVEEVVEPSARIIESFLNGVSSIENGGNACENIESMQSDLWNQYACEACGNKILRGKHEWEQHRQGRGHRKRISRLKKSRSLPLKGMT